MKSTLFKVLLTVVRVLPEIVKLPLLSDTVTFATAMLLKGIVLGCTVTLHVWADPDDGVAVIVAVLLDGLAVASEVVEYSKLDQLPFDRDHVTVAGASPSLYFVGAENDADTVPAPMLEAVAEAL